MIARKKHTSRKALSEQQGTLAWEDVKDSASMVRYYKQRLGPAFRIIPSVKITTDQYLSLIVGPNGEDLYARMCAFDPEAAKEAFVTFSPVSSNSLDIIFPIDNAEPGTKFCAFVANNTKTDFHTKLLKCLINLASQARELHWQWKKGGSKIHELASDSRYNGAA